MLYALVVVVAVVVVFYRKAKSGVPHIPTTGDGITLDTVALRYGLKKLQQKENDKRQKKIAV